MKILHLITSLRIGGAEIALLNRLAAMQSQNLEHAVVCFYQGPVVELIQKLGIRVIVIKGMFKGYDPVGLWQLHRVALAFNPDIIHASLWAANIAARWLGKRLHIPVINELHGNVAHEGKLRNILEKWTLTGAHRVVAVSASVRQTYEQHLVAALPNTKQQFIASRLLTIPNGIDRDALLERLQRHPVARQELGLQQDDFVIGAIGRFEKIKSYDLLIRSVARLRELLSPVEWEKVKVVLIGDGSQRLALEELTAALDLQQHIIFTGYRVDAYLFYSLFDCFALSSQSEGLSIALLEAVALGIPVITTNLTMQHDAIEPGKNGLLIPVNDIAAYAQGLAALYHQQLVKSGDGTPLYDFPFSIEKVTQAYQALYYELIAQPE